MGNSLQHKIAVITGGSSGIGLATAKRFVAEGAFVFITGRRQAELDKAVAEIGDNVAAIQADSSSLPELDRVYETVRAQQGRSTSSLPMPESSSMRRSVRSPRNISTGCSRSTSRVSSSRSRRRCR